MCTAVSNGYRVVAGWPGFWQGEHNVPLNGCGGDVIDNVVPSTYAICRVYCIQV